MHTSPPSFQSLLITVMSQGVQLGTATGFVVRHDNIPYLVTNHHVAAGLDPSNGNGLPPPDVLRVSYTVSTSPQVEWLERDERVLDVNSGQPLWLEHPDLGSRVDVVAIRLDNTEGLELHPHDLAGSSQRLRARPSDGLSIVGFPFGVTAGKNFGVWIRGFLASEPDVDWQDLPCFLIDARTRPGQSGSPVLNHSPSGAINIPGGMMTISARPISNLLGVYSGRIDERSDIGVVWKTSALRDIITGQQIGKAT